MPKDQVQKVAPLKLKLSLSSASLQTSAPSTPSYKSLRDDTITYNSTPGAGPSTSKPITPSIRIKAPQTPITQHTPTTPAPAQSAISTPSSVRSTVKKSGSKAKSAKKKVVASKSKLPRPSAIPPRLLSSGPTTPRSNASALPSIPSSSSVVDTTPLSTPGKIVVKLEDDDEDPLSLPLSPGAGEITTPAPRAEGDEGTPPSFHFVTPDARGRQPVKWQRLKKPLRELLDKTLVELRRRDEYDLFGEPVHTEDFPDYLRIIGGEDKMMDLGTMQQKADDGEYKSIDDFDADLHKLVDAAVTFNPAGTVPHNAAKKLLMHGNKLVERYRPIVKTPSPSPEPERSARDTPRGGSAISGREGTAPLGSTAELPPRLRIPTEMLAYPANSLAALAVGWNLTGGRRVYAKRQIRGRERFPGKWRHWSLDGTRDIAEMDDVDEWFASQRKEVDETSLRKPDWMKIRKAADWWELDLGGPNGQPPIPLAPYPTPTALQHRDLGVTDWALYPEIEAETRILASKGKTANHTALSQQLRPDKLVKDRKPVTTQPFVNIYDGHLDVRPNEVLSEALFGDITGEAYARSVQKFIEGATKMANTETPEDEKPDVTSAEDRVDLSAWVGANWRGGAMESRPIVRARQALEDLYEPSSGPSKHHSAALKIAEEEYARQALKRMARYENELDILPLLREPTEFLYPGIGGRANVATGMAWVCKELPRLIEKQAASRASASALAPDGKRKLEDGDEVDKVEVEPVVKKAKIEPGATTIDSAASSPLTLPPDTPTTSPRRANGATEGDAKKDVTASSTENAEMKQLRLELSALCKFYPLHALKKMSKADAERLLPQNVRGLMSKKE